MLKRVLLTAIFLFSSVMPIVSIGAEKPFITVASTTSTENSGLFQALNPVFAAQSGIDVKVVAVGTGKAIKIAQSGDADVLFVHHQPSEEQFVSDGYGVKRYAVMYNDFVLVGPKDDPAGVANANGVAEAMERIAKLSTTPFLSRGDDSGTHKKELSLWQLAGGIGDKGRWYLETGQGMGKTLGMAVQLEAYTLTDRATWLHYTNAGGLDVLYEGEPPLFNQYGIIRVNEKRFDNVKAAMAQQYIDFIVSDEGQQAIDGYTINQQQAFFANYNAQ